MNNKTKLRYCFTLIALLMGLYSMAANRHWVGNGSNKNWNATANWSATSGGAGGVSVPSSADNVYFNAGGTGQCIINLQVVVNQMTIDSSYTDTIKQNGNILVFGTGGYIQNGGVFWGSNVAGATITSQGIYTLNKGTFKSTNSILRIQGHFTIKNAAAFIHNSGLVFFGGIFTIKAAVTLYDCQFYTLALGGTFNLDASTILTIDHLLAQSGIINGTGVIHVHGDISQPGGVITTGGTATIYINGSTDQTFNGGTLTNNTGGATCHININKPSGTLFLSNIIAVGGDWINVNNTTINAGTSTLVFYGTKTIKEIQTLNHVSIYSPGISATTTITSGTTLKVAGNLAIGGIAQSILGGDIEAQGNITGLSYHGQGMAYNTNSIVINGTGDQLFTGTTAIGQGILRGIKIDKPSGTLKLSGLISISGTWTWLQGSVDVDTYSSTVAFMAASYIAGNQSFKNLLYYGVSGGLTNHILANASTTVTVKGDLTLQSVGTGRININTGSMDVKGNITLIPGNSITTSDFGGTTTIKINGDGNQTITGPSSYQSQVLLPHVLVNKPSGNLNLEGIITAGGNWTHIAGNVVPGTSTLAFAGYLSTITGSFETNHLTFISIAPTNQVSTIASGTTLTANGTLTMAGTGGVAINTGTIDVVGNLSITNSSTFSGGSAVINMTAAADQVVTSTAVNPGYGRIPQLKINKSGGKITFGGTITIHGNWNHIAGTLDFSALANKIVLSGTGTLTALQNFNKLSFQNATYEIPVTNPVTVEGELKMELSATPITLNTGTIHALGNITIINDVPVNGGGSALINISGTGNQLFTGNAYSIGGVLCNVTINKPSGTLTLANTISLSVSSAWNYIQGTVDPGTSNFSCISGATINCGTALSNMQFYNFRIHGGSITTNLSGLLNVKNNMTIDQARSLTTNNYDVTIGGHLYAVGSLYCGTSTINLNGTGRQVLTVASNLYRIKIDKPSGKVYLDYYPIHILNKLSLIKGVIVCAGTALIKMADNATTEGASNLSYVVGPFTKIGDEAFTFPLGDTTLPDTSAYHPLSLSATASTTNSYTAQYYAKNQLTDHPTFTALQSSLKSISTCEYWSLTRNAGTSVVLPTLNWNKNSCNTGLPAELRVGGWDGSQWKNMGQASLTGNTAIGSITAVSPGINATTQYYTLGLVPHLMTFNTQGLDSLSLPDTLKYSISGAGLTGTYVVGGIQNFYPNLPATGTVSLITIHLSTQSGQSVDIGVELTPSGVIKNPHVIGTPGPLQPPCNIHCLDLGEVIKINECIVKNCFKFSTTVYAVLKRELDGGYFQIINGDFRFKFDEEYNKSNGKLSYRLYNDAHKLLTDTKTIPVGSQYNSAYGSNYFSISLQGCYDNIPFGAGYYVIELENEKKEIWTARLKNVPQGVQPACQSGGGGIDIEQ